MFQPVALHRHADKLGVVSSRPRPLPNLGAFSSPFIRARNEPHPLSPPPRTSRDLALCRGDNHPELDWTGVAAARETAGKDRLESCQHFSISSTTLSRVRQPLN
ncbi:hypothetical protein RRG08_037971 [Elysia crispata]|uniref:Uncharacterized protein n=1 Tax=Elysia crispata TaxID=231223 RepID=A0AAE1ABV0_9GAST|nr:hypothetical protein RRG08_037971 [Elysia crispata]